MKDAFFGVETIRDVPFASTPERMLLLDIARPVNPPDKPSPAIIYLHGGGWYTGDKSAGANYFLAERGYFTISPQYRLSHEATFPAPVHDVKAAVRWLRAHATVYHIDPARIGVWGHSAGGHMAAFLGTSAGLADYAGNQHPDHDESVQAVVSVAGIVRLDDGKPRPADSPTGRLLGDAPANVPERARAFNPITHIRDDVTIPPFLILHGTADQVVHPKHADYLYESLRTAGVDATLIPIADGDHMLGRQWYTVEGLVLQFFDRILRGTNRTL